MDTLRDAIKECADNEPWCSGVCNVPREEFQLYFGDKSSARVIDIPTATEAQLDDLCAVCKPETFGLDQESVLDLSYRKALKLDKNRFAFNLTPNQLGIGKAIRPTLVRREKDTRDVIFDLYKLNIYGKDFFFKPHKDTPRGDDMFGSLVIVLPTKHEGGALVLRHKDKELKFDSAKLLKNQHPEAPSVAFVAFYSDVDHEVERVTSGKRITITYNLHYAPIMSPMVRVGPQGELLKRCTEALKAFLSNPSVLPRGGYIGFGLSHQYPMSAGNQDLKELHVNLKGGDAILYEACEEAGLEVSLRPVYSGAHYEFMSKDVIDWVDFVGDLDSVMYETKSIPIDVHYDDRPNRGKADYRDDSDSESDLEYYEEIARAAKPDFIWVSGPSSRNTLELALTTDRQLGNEPSITYLYGTVNMIVHVLEPSRRSVVADDHLE